MSTEPRPPWWAFWKKKGASSSASSGKPWWAFWKKPLSKVQTKELPAVPSERLPPRSPSAFVDEDTQTLDVSMFKDEKTDIKKAMPPLPDTPPPPPPPPRPGSKKAAVQEAKPPLVAERSQEKQAHVAADLADTGHFFGAFYVLFVLAFSIPLWLSPWPPMQEAATSLGLSAAFGYTDTTSPFGQAFVFRWLMYPNGLSVGSLWFLSAVLPPDIALLLLLQIALLLTPLCFLALLLVAGSSRWSVFFAFFFLYTGLFLYGDLGALLALPVIFLALASLFKWAAEGSILASFSTAFLAAFLVLLDLTSFAIFFTLSALCLLFLSRGIGESIANLLLLSLSLVVLAPWGYDLWYGDGGQGQSIALQGLASVVWPDPWERLQAAVKYLSFPLGGFELPILAILGGFWLVGAIARFLRPNFRGEAWSSRSFFALAGLLALGIYLFFPSEAYGRSFSPTLALIVAAFLLAGSSHLSPHTISGSLLLSGITLLGLFHAVLLGRQILAHKAEIAPLMEILETLPRKSRVLVWKLGQTPSLSLPLRAVGGFHMASKQGLSNLPLRSAPMTFIVAHPKRPFPSPEARRFPSLQGWQYLLTASRLPPSIASNVRLLRSKGGFSLYLLSGGSSPP